MRKPGEDSGWSGLCRAAGLAAVLLILYSLATMIQLVTLGGPPATAGEAFKLLADNPLVGLLRLDLPTVLVMPLYYLLFLGLYAALRRDDDAKVTLAAVLVFVGVTLVIATPNALPLLSLSRRYAVATSDTARNQLLAAGEAILASDLWHSTGAMVGGILGQAGAVLMSVAMLRSKIFSRTTAWMGILMHGLDLVHIAVAPVLPSFGFVCMAIAGPFYPIWFFLVGRTLIGIRPDAATTAASE